MAIEVGGTDDGTANTASFSFSGVSIGTEDRPKLVVVCATAGRGSNNRTWSSITVGGNAATLHETQNMDGANVMGTAIASRLVSGGTSATIGVTFSGAVLHCAIRVFVLYDLASSTPFDSNSNAATGTSVSTTVNVPANGYVIAVHGAGATSENQTFTGVATEVDDVRIESTNKFHTGYSEGLSAETGRAITGSSASSLVRRISVVSWAGVPTGVPRQMMHYRRLRV